MGGVTKGPWHYMPSQSRQIVSESGKTVCTMHRGKAAQYNGPIVAAAWEVLDALKDLRGWQSTAPQEVIDAADAAIAKAEGVKE